MSFKCKEVGCGKTVRNVQDIRNCTRCVEAGIAKTIPAHHDDDDLLSTIITGAAWGALFASGFSESRTETPSYSAPEPDPQPEPEPFEGGGGESSGGGASASFEPSDN